MIKELVQFTKHVISDPIFNTIGVTPREGLHVVLGIENADGQTIISDKPLFAGVYSKKMKEWDAQLDDCAAWAQAAWMIDTNKCFDVPTKAIHSCSPFCFAIKRTNIEGGEQYLDNQAKKKSQVYDRIEGYFTKAVNYLKTAEDKAIADAFRVALKDPNRVQRWLESSSLFKEVKDGDYVIVYLDIPVERYIAANQLYKKENLFNTPNYNQPDLDNPDLVHGTSNWFNGFPTKKPFLQHQSATFDISNRINSEETALLDLFSDLNRRKILPNPLPVFIYDNERKDIVKILKEDNTNGSEKKRGYLEIIAEMWEERRKRNHELGNYYLLFTVAGDIRDFDFVSRFEYNLNPDASPCIVRSLFGSGMEMRLHTVFDLMTQVLPPMFNNSLIVHRKEEGWIFRWFDEINPKYCKTHNAFLLAMKYRKAFYDFIYKSQRQGVSAKAIEEILLTGIMDDIRLDKYEGKYNTESQNIRMKLNLLFSLHTYFSHQPNPRFMPDNIIQLREKVEAIAKEGAHIDSDELFAFAAGQVVDRIFFAANTSDKSFGYLEPFLAQTDATRFKLSISNFFKRYKHANFSQRFRKVCAEVLAYPKNGSIKELQPLFLAGVFSESQLFSEKNDKENTIETSTSN